MALFDLQPRSTRVSDSQAIRKSTTSKKVNTGVTIKGSGGLLDRITAITTAVLKNLGKYTDRYQVIRDEHILEQFIDKWKKLAIDKKDLRYYVVDTEKYNRLMNYYGEPTAKDEKPTLNSIREVESASNLYYYWED